MDFRVSEHTRLTGLPEGWANSRELQFVVLWDKGPTKPEAPKRPKAPVGKDGEPEYDLAMVDFREAVVEYEAGMKTFKLARDEFSGFEQRHGGPIEIQMWSCDAQDALTRDPKRYCISSKTRGYERLKNRGLPVGLAPGHGQSELERRTEEGEADLFAIRRADPVFGQAAEATR